MPDRTTAFSTWCCASANGRDLKTRKTAGEHVFQALSRHLDPVFAASKFALSFDMQINDKDTSWKRNNIHDALKVEASHG
ncbi:5-carboxymethyl-2-hydroxymuconate isomerase [Bradyrhizobium sp. LM3.2]